MILHTLYNCIQVYHPSVNLSRALYKKMQEVRELLAFWRLNSRNAYDLIDLIDQIDLIDPGDPVERPDHTALAGVRS